MHDGRQAQSAEGPAFPDLPAEGAGQRYLPVGTALDGHLPLPYVRRAADVPRPCRYCVPAPVAMFASPGARPNTFTPAPRATSIRSITSMNFRELSALMKISLSGRTL